MIEVRCSNCKGIEVVVNLWLPINKLPSKIGNIANISSLLSDRSSCFCYDCGINVDTETINLDEEKE